MDRMLGQREDLGFIMLREVVSSAVTSVVSVHVAELLLLAGGTPALNVGIEIMRLAEALVLKISELPLYILEFLVYPFDRFGEFLFALTLAEVWLNHDGRNKSPNGCYSLRKVSELNYVLHSFHSPTPLTARC